MNNNLATLRRLPPVATLVGAGLFLLGFVLASLDWRFLTLSALGAFGPAILREWGWIRDKDEFQLEAARRAGYHAYLAGGFVALVLVGMLKGGGQTIRFPSELVSGILGIMWLTWLFSSLYTFWGPGRTVKRVLTIFGIVWLVFNVLANTGPEWAGPIPLLMQSALALPFFALAWTAGRWPRVTGLLLLVMAGFFFHLFGMSEIFGPEGLDRAFGIVFVLFIGPLLASGIMLLVRRELEEE